MVYTAKVVHQHATLTFVDDDEGGKVLTQYTATASGDAGNGITFANGLQNLSDLLAKHYLFNGADDTTAGTPVKLQSDATAANPYPTIRFGNYDNDDDQVQSFVIHLTHQTEAVCDSHQANLVVHYVYGNGPLQGSQTHLDQTAPAITFTRTEILDLVTGDVVSDTPWTPNQLFDAVPSPQIGGYAPDYEIISDIVATPTTDTINKTVTYHTVSGDIPSTTPSQAPSDGPSQVPSEVPSGTPSQAPSETPSQAPSEVPSDNPSQVLSEVPSDNPSLAPSEVPSNNPSLAPSEVPTTPQPSQTPGQPDSQSPSPSPARDGRLPQTGNQSSRLSWIGLGLLSMTALLGLGKPRRHD